MNPTIGIILGDPAGIGPELVAKLYCSGFFAKHCRPLVIGDVRVLKSAFDIIGAEPEIQAVKTPEDIDWDQKVLTILDIPMQNLDNLKMGEINKDCGAACVEWVKVAVALYQKGVISGVCYAPLNKGAMLLGGNPVESELELVAMLLDCKDAYCEMNMLDNVWTTRITSHIPLCDVSKDLTVESIYKSIKLCDKSLRKAGFQNPRVGVAALNPHAGENGHCGTEEIDLITPAIEKAAAEGINVTRLWKNSEIWCLRNPAAQSPLSCTLTLRWVLRWNWSRLCVPVM